MEAERRERLKTQAEPFEEIDQSLSDLIEGDRAIYRGLSIARKQSDKPPRND